VTKNAISQIKQTRHSIAQFSAVIYKVCLLYCCNCHASAVEESAAEATRFRVRHLAVRVVSVSTYFAWLSISLLSGRTSVKLGRNIHYVNGYCWKGFQGQRSKVKVMTRWNTIKAEACILTASYRGSIRAVEMGCKKPKKTFFTKKL